MIKLLSRTARHNFGVRCISIKNKVSLYKSQGFVVFPKELSSTDIESLSQSANNIINNHPDQSGKEIIARLLNRGIFKDEYLYFSGGKTMSNDVKSINLGKGIKQIMGNGINVLTNELHNEVKEFENIAYSKMVKKITRGIFKMNAPIIVASSYVSSLDNDWNSFRKDNSFIRTNPLSTQVTILLIYRVYL